MSTLRAYTEEEVRQQVIDHIWALVDHWMQERRVTNDEERLSGLAHSILVMLDGCGSLPAFEVRPNPHHEDQATYRASGMRWYPDDVDIAGSLHEQFFERRKKVGIDG